MLQIIEHILLYIKQRKEKAKQNIKLKIYKYYYIMDDDYIINY